MTMCGRIDVCVLVSLRVEAGVVEAMVPRPVEVVTLERGGVRWGFLNVVLCRIEGMRPVGVPAALGVSYTHIAYRVMVRWTGAGGGDGVERRGLYFLRSDVDSPVVAGMGNLVSDFRMHAGDARVWREGDAVRAVCGEGESDHPARVWAEVDASGPGGLAEGSVFADEGEAAGFLKYEPLGLSPTRDGRGVRLAEVMRDEAAWRERAARVVGMELGYLRPYERHGLAVERATAVEPIEYRWRLGRSLRA